jgi:hypothetical protein
MRGMHNMMMIPVVGAAESLLTGAAGLMAVNEAIKQTPDLAYAANGAMQQFNKGIRQTASDAIGEGVPALHQLGHVLHGLGNEVGSVGAEHMGTALGAVSDLAGRATTDLAKLDPAIGSSIRGLNGLGDAVMDGISSPSSVQGIKSVGESLADPGNQQGLTSLVSGLSTVSTLAAKVATDVGGTVGQMTGTAGDNFTPALQGGGLVGLMTRSPFAGAAAGLGIFQAQQEEASGHGDLVTPGLAGAGLAAYLGKKALGLKGGPLGVAALAGDAIATGAAAAIDSGHGGAFGQPGSGNWWRDQMPKLPWEGWGADDPSSRSNPSHNAPGLFSGGSWANKTGQGASPFPAGQAAPYGWNQDAKGNLTPSAKPTSQDQKLATQASSRAQALQTLNAPRTAADVAKASGGAWHGLPPVVPGPGSSIHAAPQSMRQLTQSTNQMSNSVQHLNQSAIQVQPHLQQMGQTSVQIGQQTQQMSQGHQQAMETLNRAPQEANRSMQRATTAIQEGGISLGSQLPKSMSQGIEANTGQACDSSAQMGAAATKCAASALGVKSPSKAFEYLGSMTGPGFAVGAKGSTPMAAAAAGNMMVHTTDVAANYAADQGLLLGETYGTNVVTGVSTVIEKGGLQALGLAQGVDSPLAKLALGQLGLLGVAGSGAQSWDLRNAGMVSFGAGTPAQAAQPLPTPQVTVYIDGQKHQAQQTVIEGFEELLTALGVGRR